MTTKARKFNSAWSKATKQYSIFLVLAVLFLICSFTNKNFLSSGNLLNISRQISVTTILAFGQTILIICGMLDLSDSAVLALSGVFAVSAYKASHSLLLAFVVGLLTGVVCNLINAVMVASFRAPAFIATLAMQAMARGMALFYTKGQNILEIDGFTVFGQGSVLGIPIPVIFLLITLAITWYLLNQTAFGRSMFAIGGNEEASIASGINTKKQKYIAFVVNGLMVGLAGILFMSRVNAGLPNGAVNYETQAITATIIGGTSFTGGIGTASGTIAGAFIVGFLDNIMNLSGVDSYIQQIVRGAIIAVAVIYDIQAKNHRVKSHLGNISEKSES